MELKFKVQNPHMTPAATRATVAGKEMTVSVESFEVELVSQDSMNGGLKLRFIGDQVEDRQGNVCKRCDGDGHARCRLMSVVILPSKKKEVRPVHEAVAELNDIAVARGKKRHIKTAIVEMKRAIAVLPNSKELWNNLGTFLWNDRKYEEALACIDRALQLDPTFFKAFYNRALILEDIGQYDEAEKHFALSLENCTTDEKYNLNWCRSMMRLSLGHYANGWEDYEDRIPFSRTPGAVNRYPIFPAPYWQGEDITGKRIFCCAEQGLGDTILFSRFLPWLRQQVGPGGKVYFCCAHEMMTLLWDFYLTGVMEFVPEGVPIPECDYSVVVGSSALAKPMHVGDIAERSRPDPQARRRPDENRSGGNTKAARA